MSERLAANARAWKGAVWRLVEAQHIVSTLKLVDTLEEQALLESVLERAKPRLPRECAGLDFLLATPFRYPSPFGSRFRRAGTFEGVFYAAEHVETAAAEIAFHRLLFYADSPATPFPREAASFTGFAASLDTARAIDLTAPPFAARQHEWTRPADYAPTQALAAEARAADIDLIRSFSVRDPERRANLAVLRCRAFFRRGPIERQSWRLRISAFGVQALCEAPRRRLEFGRRAFDNDPRMAGFVWERRAAKAEGGKK